MICIGALLLAGLGCGKAAPTAQPAPEKKPDAASAAAKAAVAATGGAAGVTMSGIKLFLYDRAPGIEGVAKKPVLRIEADLFTSAGEKEWTFQKAHAFMVSRKTQEEWQIEANQGRMKEDENAFLEGDVTAQLGTMTVHLQDIAFETPADGAPKAAHSDKPVTVHDPGMDLAASSIQLYPDEKRFELTEVSGTISFDKEAQ